MLSSLIVFALAKVFHQFLLPNHIIFASDYSYQALGQLQKTCILMAAPLLNIAVNKVFVSSTPRSLLAKIVF